jgi:predicted ATPase
MYLNKVSIKNIRSVKSFEMTFEEPAGWHVIIGDNGAGKSTIVRSIALGIVGPNDARALRLNLNNWIRWNSNESGKIHLTVTKHPDDKKSDTTHKAKKKFDAILSLIDNKHSGYILEGNKGLAFESIWSNSAGWFSCAFGPFRRFTGGEKEWMKVYYSDPRAAAHLSVFGEDVALTEAIDWLKDLHIKNLENNSLKSDTAFILDALKSFLNEGGLLPHNSRLDSISSEGVFFIDGNGSKIDVTQMSDGYRSILSLTFELIRQLVRSYGSKKVFRNFNQNEYFIDMPGVVLIDEIDAHLHPTWQARIGQWFTKVFPKIQFIVTTHSPLICRAAETGTIWRLRAPGTDQDSEEVLGIDRERLLFGDLLDAYGTELFGNNVTQSESGQELSAELAGLTLKSFKGTINSEENLRLSQLKAMMPSNDTTN